MNSGPVPSSILTNLYILCSRYCFHGPCPPSVPSAFRYTWQPVVRTSVHIRALPYYVRVLACRPLLCRAACLRSRSAFVPIYRFSGSATTMTTTAFESPHDGAYFPTSHSLKIWKDIMSWEEEAGEGGPSLIHCVVSVRVLATIIQRTSVRWNFLVIMSGRRLLIFDKTHMRPYPFPV